MVGEQICVLFFRNNMISIFFGAGNKKKVLLFYKAVIYLKIDICQLDSICKRWFKHTATLACLAANSDFYLEVVCWVGSAAGAAWLVRNRRHRMPACRHCCTPYLPFQQTTISNSFGLQSCSFSCNQTVVHSWGGLPRNICEIGADAEMFSQRKYGLTHILFCCQVLLRWEREETCP